MSLQFGNPNLLSAHLIAFQIHFQISKFKFQISKFPLSKKTLIVCLLTFSFGIRIQSETLLRDVKRASMVFLDNDVRRINADGLFRLQSETLLIDVKRCCFRFIKLHLSYK